MSHGSSQIISEDFIGRGGELGFHLVKEGHLVLYSVQGLILGYSRYMRSFQVIIHAILRLDQEKSRRIIKSRELLN